MCMYNYMYTWHTPSSKNGSQPFSINPECNVQNLLREQLIYIMKYNHVHANMCPAL